MTHFLLFVFYTIIEILLFSLIYWKDISTIKNKKNKHLTYAHFTGYLSFSIFFTYELVYGSINFLGFLWDIVSFHFPLNPQSIAQHQSSAANDFIKLINAFFIYGVVFSLTVIVMRYRKIARKVIKIN